jgi:hypothetical protein
MPYRSAKQRAFMHARHPEIAARWDAKYGGKIVPKKKAAKKATAKKTTTMGGKRRRATGSSRSTMRRY